MDAIITFLEGKKVYIAGAVLGLVNLGVVLGFVGPDATIDLEAEVIAAIDAVLAALVIVFRRAAKMRVERGGQP